MALAGCCHNPLPRRNLRNLRVSPGVTKYLQNGYFAGKRLQRVQRLFKTLHRDDPQVSCIAARSCCVFPSRDEEHVGSGRPDAVGLLLDASHRADGAVELDLAGRRDPVAAVDVVPELLEDLQREREAGRRAADVAEVDADVQRQLDPRVLRDADADDRALLRRPERRPCSCVRSSVLPSRRSRSRTSSPGSIVAVAFRSCATVSALRPSTATITSPLSSAFAAGTSTATDSTRTPRGVAPDVEACGAHRDRGRDLLGPVHLHACFGDPLAERLAGRGHRVRRNERRAVRAQEREDPLEPAHLPHGDVDVVDASGAAGIGLALDLDLRGDRVGAVRDEEVVARRKRRHQEDDGGEQDDAGEGEPAGRRRIFTGARA